MAREKFRELVSRKCGPRQRPLEYDNIRVATVQKHNSERGESVDANVTLGNSRDNHHAHDPSKLSDIAKKHRITAKTHRHRATL